MTDPESEAMLQDELESAMWDVAPVVAASRPRAAITQARVSSRDTAEQAEAKRELAATLRKLGMTIESWFADVDPAAHFLGLPIAASKGRAPGVHKLLLRRLARVELRLMQELGTASLAECARQLNVYSVSGMRSPQAATGAEGVSMHCFGLAIDVNYTGNPFLQEGSEAAAVIQRATRLVSGTAVNVLSPPLTGDPGKTWDRLRRASDDLIGYFALRDPGNLPTLTTLAARSAQAVSWWRAKIAEDYKLLYHHGSFVQRDPQRGFLDLDRRLVRALVETGGLLWGGMYRAGKDLMHFDWRGFRRNRANPKSWLQAEATPVPLRPPIVVDASMAAEPSLRGRTIYASIPLGQDRARIRDTNHRLVRGPLISLPARTGIFIPEAAQPSRRIDIIVYLHGFLTNVCGRNKTPGHYDQIDDYWKNPYFLLREGLCRTGRNFILVVPSLGPHAQAGALRTPGGFDRYMAAILAAIGKRGGATGAQTPPDIGQIILAGHSAGGSTMRVIATGGDAYARKIRECWGFDCLYDGGDASAWAGWAKTSPDARLYVYYTSTGGTAANSAELRSRGLPNVTVEQAQTLHTRNPHCEVPRAYWQRRIQLALRQSGTPGATDPKI